MSNLQYITDTSGVPTSVVIPITDWNLLSEYIEKVRKLEQICEGIRQGLQEVKAIEAGRSKGTLAKDFLDAL